jgi:hypothetical protein
VGEERSKGYWEKTKEGWEKFSSAKEKEEDRIYNEIAKVAGALHGNPGDFLDVLLTLYGDKHKPEDIKRLVRSFEELNLSELHQSSGGGGWGSTLLEFYFQQASLVNQKQERDRQTLIQVFLKIAFRDLMKTESQVPIIEELYKRRKDGIFFEELAEAVRSLVEESMVYQPKHIKTKLLPHQSVAAYFLNSHPRAHLGDFTGAGKTIEVLEIQIQSALEGLDFLNVSEFL